MDARADHAKYEAIDTFAIRGIYIEITGTVQGASAATTKTFSVSDQDHVARCERYLVLAMNRPGRFFVAIDEFDSAVCQLERRP